MTVERPTARIVADAELHFTPAAEQIVSMPALRSTPWTLSEVERLVEERPGYAPRYELVDGGLLVTPAPSRRHQRIVGELYRLVYAYVARQGVGEAMFSPATVTLTSETRVEPDVFVMPSIDGRRVPAAAVVDRLILAVEVLSPSSAHHDRVTKRRFFQRNGVPEYWIIDGEAEVFEIWHPSDERPSVADDRLIWHPDGAAEPLVLHIAAFFAGVADGSLLAPADP